MNKFRLQVTFSLGVILALVIVVIAFLDFLAFRSESIALNKHIIAERNAALESTLSEKLLSYKLVLSALKIENHQVGSDYLTTSNASSLEDISNVLAGKVNGVYLFDKEGSVYKKDGKKSKSNYKTRSYFKALFNEGDTFFVSTPYVNKNNGKRSIAIAYKVNQDVAVSATLHLDFVLGKLKTLKQLYLYADGGKIVIAPSEEMLGKKLKDIRPEFLTLNATNPEFVYKETTQDGKVEFDAFWGQLDIQGWGKGWQYVSIIETNIITRGAQRQLITSLVIGFICFLISCAVIVWVMNRLVLKPVGGSPEEIGKLVETMASGNLSLKLSNPGDKSGIFSSVIAFSSQLSSLVKNSLGISESVASASQELTAVMTETLNNIEKEKQQVELISKAINNLSETSKEVSEQATSAEELTKVGVEKLEVGKVSLEQNMALSNDINQSVNTTASIIDELQNFSIEIDSVTEVINGISEQTNLLALNAAIEAARAGEAGRGFAVVADEVRALASKTQQSTLSIQDLISKLQAQSKKASTNMQHNVELIHDSVKLAGKVKTSFEEISVAIDAISEINTLVAKESQDQNAVTDKISQNTSDALDLVQQNASAVNQTLNASKELAQLAETQKDELAFFKV
ncbi:methyl-accepting chemotaxis protein [Paraglaciecola sp. 2405UD69-4]|uniref:methyl-accepting chemotaxis protein n=1 Tax=Paraglaciecola sp. 2405UD69-4 TaxID=3391836 RepID=UPI0039C9639C